MMRVRVCPGNFFPWEILDGLKNMGGKVIAVFTGLIQLISLQMRYPAPQRDFQIYQLILLDPFIFDYSLYLIFMQMLSIPQLASASVFPLKFAYPCDL